MSKREVSNWGPFAGRLKTPEQVPEQLRGAPLGNLAPQGIRLLIFTPADRDMAKDSEPTIFALTDQEWLMASWSDAGSVRVAKCDFANTLLVEMTSILLYGLLRIDFATPDPGFQKGRVPLSPQPTGSPKVVFMSATPEERLAEENRRLRQENEALESKAQALQSEKQALETQKQALENQVQELETLRRNLEHTVAVYFTGVTRTCVFVGLDCVSFR